MDLTTPMKVSNIHGEREVRGDGSPGPRRVVGSSLRQRYDGVM